jgi:hypothetical protein
MNRRWLRSDARWSVAETRRIVCLVCLLGVTLSAALLPHISTDQLGWVFAHLE